MRDTRIDYIHMDVNMYLINNNNSLINFSVFTTLQMPTYLPIFTNHFRVLLFIKIVLIIKCVIICVSTLIHNIKNIIFKMSLILYYIYNE